MLRKLIVIIQGDEKGKKLKVTIVKNCFARKRKVIPFFSTDISKKETKTTLLIGIIRYINGNDIYTLCNRFFLKNSKKKKEHRFYLSIYSNSNPTIYHVADQYNNNATSRTS